MSFIIILEINVSGGDTHFYRINIELEKQDHLLKYLYWRYAVDSFDRIFHAGTIWFGHGSVISFNIQKYTFLHFYHHVNVFHERYINAEDWTNYIKSIWIVERY